MYRNSPYPSSSSHASIVCFCEFTNSEKWSIQNWFILTALLSVVCCSIGESKVPCISGFSSYMADYCLIVYAVFSLYINLSKDTWIISTFDSCEGCYNEHGVHISLWFPDFSSFGLISWSGVCWVMWLLYFSFCWRTSTLFHSSLGE